MLPSVGSTAKVTMVLPSPPNSRVIRQPPSWRAIDQPSVSANISGSAPCASTAAANNPIHHRATSRSDSPLPPEDAAPPGQRQSRLAARRTLSIRRNMARDRERGRISRRTLLVGGGAGVGLALAWGLWPRSYRPNLRAADGETLFNAFLKIGRDGRVVVAVPQAELGQGVYTSLPQILADELGADWRTVSVEPAPISPLYANLLLAEEASADSAFPSVFGIDRWTAREYAARNALMVTAGSTSVRGFEPRLREAGAAARALLAMAAARRWNVDWQELDAHGGFVWRGDDRIPFAELAEAAAREGLPDHLPVRGGLEHRLVRPAAAEARPPRQDRRLGAFRRGRPAARHGSCRGAQRAARQPPRRPRPRRRARRARHDRDRRRIRTGSALPPPTGGRRRRRSTRSGRATSSRSGRRRPIPSPRR